MDDRWTERVVWPIAGTEMNQRIAFHSINLLVTSVWGISHRMKWEQEFALWPFKLGRRGSAWLAAHQHSSAWQETDSVEQNLSWRADGLSCASVHPALCGTHRFITALSQDPSAGPFRKPDESSPYSRTWFFIIIFNIYASICGPG
jgi:hypothetical protein